MDKVYIKLKELDIYDYLRIEWLRDEFGFDLQDIISVDELLRIIECLYSEYRHLEERVEDIENENNNK